jgi:hypothetical protein
MSIILQPPSALIMGPSGSGKTASIVTQLLAGLEVFVIVTEPDGVASLLDRCFEMKIPIDKLHWTTCMPASAGWAGFEQMIMSISTMDQKQLADQRDMGKKDFRPAAMKFLDALKDFPCERTGVNYGCFTDWDETRSLNIDSLTGWSFIAWGCTVGYKPTANPGEWGIGQTFISNMLLKINTDRRCYFNLIAHVEKEMDEILGIKKVMVSTLGAKLAPKIPSFFSEGILTKRTIVNGQPTFTWATIDTGADLKNRALPIGANLKPDYRPIVEAYERRKKQIAQVQTVQPGPVTPVTPVLPIAPMQPASVGVPKP